MGQDSTDEKKSGKKSRSKKKKLHKPKGQTFDNASQGSFTPNGEPINKPITVQHALQKPRPYNGEVEDIMETGLEPAPEYMVTTGSDPTENQDDDQIAFYDAIEEQFNEHEVQLPGPEQQALNNNGQYAYVTSEITLKKEDQNITIPKYSKVVISSTKIKKTYKVLYSKNPLIVTEDAIKIPAKNCLLTGLDTEEAEKIDYSDSTEKTHTNVLDSAEMTKDVYDNFIGNNGMSGMVDHLSKTRYENGDIRALAEGDTEYSEGKTASATNLAFVGDGAAALFGFVSVIRNLKTGDNAWETYENFLDGSFGAAKIVEGVGKVVGAATGDSTAADTGVMSEMVTHEIGAIKSAFLLIKKSVDLYKHHEEMSTKEKGFMGASMIQDATNMAHEAMYMVKNIQELLNGGTIGASVMASMPGLSVVMNAIDLITQGFYLGIAIHHKVQMEKIRKPIEESASNTAETMDQEIMINAHGSKRKHGKSILNPLVNEQDEIEANIAVLQALIQEEEMSPGEWIVNKSIYENTKKYGSRFHKRTAAYKRAKKQEKNRDRIKGYKEILAEEKTKLEALQERTSRNFGGNFEIYDMAKEMSNINQKRINRSILHIVSDIAQITGDVLNLSGVGALAGGISKASGAALEGAAFITRTSKQAFHNKGARQKQKDKDTVYSRNANSTKSSQAKKAKRTKHAVQILSMFKSVNPDADETTADAELAKFNLAKNFVSASGGSMKRLSTFDDPETMVSYLSESMAQRDI